MCSSLEQFRREFNERPLACTTFTEREVVGGDPDHVVTDNLRQRRAAFYAFLAGLFDRLDDESGDESR